MVRPLVATLLVLLLSAACTAPGAPTRLETTTTVGATPTASASATAAAAATPRATPASTRVLPRGVARVIDLNGEMTWGIAAAGETLWVEGDFVLHQLDAASG